MTTAPEVHPDSSATAVVHNVPVALSSFVGRTGDLAGLAASLSANRLVTLVGAGGAGKTRLAREVAARFALVERDGARYPDGVWWVELAPLRDGADVAAALASVLGVSPSPGRRITDALTDALRTQRALLVFDNCEHVVDDVARLANDVLRAAPTINLMTTSREPLSIDGEVAWPVPPFERPVTGDAPTDRLRAVDAAPFDAVRLFVERAAAVTPGFQLTDANAHAIATICARLDGLPLALELAAAVVPVIGVDGLASRLDSALSLLSRGKRSALPRHRTLRAVLDWSYALLTDAERILLRRLSVFCAPCTLDAIEDVCADARFDVLASLGRLVEHSLVEVREDHGESRYRLLETVRQYASELLVQSPDEHAVRERHARWITALAVASEPAMFSPARGRTIDRLRQSIDDIRAALLWATGPGRSPMQAVRLAGALGWYWISGLPWEEARTLLAMTLASADAEGIADADRPVTDRIALGQLQYPIEGLAFFGGDTDAMMRTATRDLAIWDSVDASAGLSDTERLTAARGRTLSLQLYSFALAMRGEVSAALPSMARCLDSARASGDRWLLSVMTMRGALMHFMVGDFDAAKRDWDAAVPELRRMGEWWFLSLALEGMANNALAMGDAPGAMHHARESILVLRPEPDAWFISRSLDTMGHILLMRAPASAAQRVEQHRLAAQLLGAAESLRRRCGAGIIGPDLERHDRMYAALRESLGATAFDEEHVAGSTLSLSDVFALMDDDRLHATSPDGESVAQAERHTVVLRVLGPFQFSRGDRVHSGEASPVGKVRELLLFLVLHDHVSKEAVGLALWPDASAAQVRNAFHVTLHHLRRLLGPEAWIVFDRDGYRLDRTPAGGIVLDIDVDAVLSWSTRLRQATRRQQRLGLDDLAAARAAFDRSRGDLAQNVVAEDWLVVHQDRVRTAWADGMDALAQQYHALEQHADVVAVCEQLVEREPLREGAHRLLMQALAAMGERARALAHFDTMSAVLQREVGAKPAAETRALAEQIRR